MLIPVYFMSMLGVGFLNEIVAESGETNPAQILNKLRKKIINSLEQKGSGETQKDGMDIAICVLRKNSKNESQFVPTLEFSGAYNPLFIVRSKSITEPAHFDKKLETDSFVLYDYKPNKMPIGNFQKMDDFTSVSIQLEKGDSLYTFSDGYQDQFGGEQDRKFMTKRMKQLFLSIQDKPMSQQQEILNSEFEKWMQVGNCEQIDDVCLVGVKV